MAVVPRFPAPDPITQAARLAETRRRQRPQTPPGAASPRPAATTGPAPAGPALAVQGQATQPGSDQPPVNQPPANQSPVTQSSLQQSSIPATPGPGTAAPGAAAEADARIRALDERITVLDFHNTLEARLDAELARARQSGALGAGAAFGEFFARSQQERDRLIGTLGLDGDGRVVVSEAARREALLRGEAVLQDRLAAFARDHMAARRARVLDAFQARTAGTAERLRQPGDQSPARFAAARADLIADGESLTGLVAPQALDDALARAEDALVTAAVDSALAAGDPDQARAILDQAAGDDSRLSPARRQALTWRITQTQTQAAGDRAATDQAVIVDAERARDLDDHAAYNATLEQTGNDDDERFSDAAIRERYADDPDTAQALITRKRNALAEGAAFVSFRLTPLNGLRTRIQTLAAKITEAASFNTAHRMAAITDVRREQMALQKVVSERQKDPGATALASNAVAMAFCNFMDSRQQLDMTPDDLIPAANSYFRSSLALQTRLQFDPIAVLPVATAKSEATQLLEQITTGAHPGSTLSAFARSFGSFWDQAYTEITPHLPSIMRVAAGLTDNQQVVTRLISTSMTEPAFNQIGSNFKKMNAIDNAIDEVSIEFRESLNLLRDGPRNFNEFQKAIRILSFSYLIDGFDEYDSVKKSFSEIIQTRYRFFRFNDNIVRLPLPNNDVLEIVPAIISGMSSILSDLDQLKVVPPRNLRERHINLYVKNLRETARFVTGDCDRGVILLDETGTAALQSDGSPINFSWLQLIEHGIASMAPTSISVENSTRDIARALATPTERTQR